MTMEFSKLFTMGVLLAGATFSAPMANASDASTEGSDLAAVKLNEVSENSVDLSGEDSLPTVQSGRALLKAEDLKRILGMNGKAPAADRLPLTQEGPFTLEFSQQELQNIRKRLFKIDREREILYAKLAKEVENKKIEIRNKRREIQNSRLGASENNDRKLSKALYESILQESNLEAQLKGKMEAFDRTHLVSIDFMQLKGQRLVQSISIGPKLVWALENRMSVANK